MTSPVVAAAEPVRIAGPVHGDAGRLHESRRVCLRGSGIHQTLGGVDVHRASQGGCGVAPWRDHRRQVDDRRGSNRGDQFADVLGVGEVGPLNSNPGGQCGGGLPIGRSVQVRGDHVAAPGGEMLDGGDPDEAERAGDQYGVAHLVHLRSDASMEPMPPWNRSPSLRRFWAWAPHAVPSRGSTEDRRSPISTVRRAWRSVEGPGQSRAAHAGGRGMRRRT